MASRCSRHGASTVCNPQIDGSPDPIDDFGEAEVLLGSTLVDTDANGDAAFSVDFAATAQSGGFATGPDGTSEFSNCIMLPEPSGALQWGAGAMLGLVVWRTPREAPSARAAGLAG